MNYLDTYLKAVGPRPEKRSFQEFVKQLSDSIHYEAEAAYEEIKSLRAGGYRRSDIIKDAIDNVLGEIVTDYKPAEIFQFAKQYYSSRVRTILDLKRYIENDIRDNMLDLESDEEMDLEEAPRREFQMAHPRGRVIRKTIESADEEKSEFGVRWSEFDKNDRIQKKEKIFSSKKACDSFISKLEKKDNFNKIESML